MAEGDDDEQRCRVIYLDNTDGEGEEECWIKRAGKVKVEYPNGHIFEGTEADNDRLYKDPSFDNYDTFYL